MAGGDRKMEAQAKAGDESVGKKLFEDSNCKRVPRELRCSKQVADAAKLSEAMSEVREVEYRGARRKEFRGISARK